MVCSQQWMTYTNFCDEIHRNLQKCQAYILSVNDIWNKSYMNCGNEINMKKWSSQWTMKPLTLGAVGRASHRYREVTGSNPVEVLNFFQASLRNCINCVHCNDHFFMFISFPQFIYDVFHISLTLISFTGTYEPTIDLLPTSVASKLSWLSIAPVSRGLGFKPRWSPELFSGFFTPLHKLRSLRRSFLHVHICLDLLKRG